MGIAALSLKPTYWEEFDVRDEDLEFLYNHLLEIETPLTPDELVQVLVKERVEREKKTLEESRNEAGTVYLPKEKYATGQLIQFPHLDWQQGTVTNIRPGHNPEIPPFDVIEVKFASGKIHQFASGYSDHKLNTPVSVNLDDPNLDPEYILRQHGSNLVRTLTAQIESNPDLVRIAGRWFPRALLVDINVGHLNLAEAILEMADGGPLPTRELMEQLDLPEEINSKLNEFSLNLALQEDERFDEVGPSGKILWYLKRLEPEPVLEPPVWLRCPPYNYNPSSVETLLNQFEGQVADELETCLSPDSDGKDVAISLIYPHFRAGTLPICDQLIRFFPTAYESPRVQFTFVDAENGEKFSGWVVREHHYVYGLREWYIKNELIAGSLVSIARSTVPGEVIIRAGRKRPTRDWVRTALVGSDGGIVFKLLKHSLSTTYDERMAIVISNIDALDEAWVQGAKQRSSLPATVKSILTELAELSPQGHVHAQELYAAVNVVRRSPPGPILSILLEHPWASHLGDLYFRYEDSSEPQG